jgi:hypothetical protein
MGVTGFTLVESRRRRLVRPMRSRPVSATLVGLCFNCMADDHVAADCRFPSRCLNCRGTGHRVRECKCGCSPTRHVTRNREAPRRRLLSQVRCRPPPPHVAQRLRRYIIRCLLLNHIQAHCRSVVPMTVADSTPTMERRTRSSGLTGGPCSVRQLGSWWGPSRAQSHTPAPRGRRPVVGRSAC